MHWWKEKPLRMVQANLREIDVDIEPERYIEDVLSFHAEAVLFNVGGIVANYDTRLGFHYRNPYLKQDLTGKVRSLCREHGIRFIARFDFSKINHEIAVNHPEWLYRSRDGGRIVYNGQVNTCVNGDYQQRFSLEILREAIEEFEVDGIFFNMPGYNTMDYGGREYGICDCDNCRHEFLHRFGKELPSSEVPGEPAFEQYQLFQKATTAELSHKIYDFIKAIDPEIAVFNYTNAGVDIYFDEANSDVDRPLPEWNYEASHHVKRVNTSWPELRAVNTSIHFLAWAFRQAAVYPTLTHQRIVQSMVNGGWPTYTVMGRFDNQDDRECFEGVRTLFRHHAENDHFYTDLRSAADVCIIEPDHRKFFAPVAEFRGLYRILAAAHIPTDVLHERELVSGNPEAVLKKYRLVIVPDIIFEDTAAFRQLDAYVEAGGTVIATGSHPSGFQTEDKPLYRSSGLDKVTGTIRNERSNNFRLNQVAKQILEGLENIDLVYCDSDIAICTAAAGVKTLAPLLEAAMTGPPEKCYYGGETETHGLLLNSFGEGRFATIPWNIGELFESHSTHSHELLFRSLALHLLQHTLLVETDAHQSVEISFHHQRMEDFSVLSLVNLSGQLGAAFFDPIPMRQIQLLIRPLNPPRSITLLGDDTSIPWETEADGRVRITLPELHLFASLVIHYRSPKK